MCERAVSAIQAVILFSVLIQIYSDKKINKVTTSIKDIHDVKRLGNSDRKQTNLAQLYWEETARETKKQHRFDS